MTRTQPTFGFLSGVDVASLDPYQGLYPVNLVVYAPIGSSMYTPTSALPIEAGLASVSIQELSCYQTLLSSRTCTFPLNVTAPSNIIQLLLDQMQYVVRLTDVYDPYPPSWLTGSSGGSNVTGSPVSSGRRRRRLQSSFPRPTRACTCSSRSQDSDQYGAHSSRFPWSRHRLQPLRRFPASRHRYLVDHYHFCWDCWGYPWTRFVDSDRVRYSALLLSIGKVQGQTRFR